VEFALLLGEIGFDLVQSLRVRKDRLQHPCGTAGDTRASGRDAAGRVRDLAVFPATISA